MAGILALFEYFGPNGWFYCWIATTIFILIIQLIAPNWIVPLFNKFTPPLESGESKEAIVKHTNSVNFPVNNVFVVDASRRSTKSNAFFAGFGRNKQECRQFCDY